MKLWLTASEIADLALPGLPGTKRNVNALAEAQGWTRRQGLSRTRKGAGGGLEYHLDLLPPRARQAYVGRLLGDPVPAEALQAAEAEPAATSLRDGAAEARDARLAILAAAERIFVEAKHPRLHADLVCVADFNSGRLAFPDWVRVQVPELTLRTLQRWRATQRQGATVRLAVDRGAARRGSGVLATAEDGRVRIAVLSLIARQPHLSADHVRTLLLERFGSTLTVRRAGGREVTVAMPPIRTVQAALSAWKASEKVALTALTNPDAFKSHYRASGSKTDAGVTRLNEVWQIDASPVDALCLDGRHSVYAAIDIYSRRVILYVSRTPRAAAVALLLRKAILAWGVPERIKTDNGSDFIAKASERLFANLGIERELSPAFTPEAKAFVERVIGTFQRDLTPLLPGFIGHSVADRQVIRAREAFAARLGQDDGKAFCVELDGHLLQGYCDAWAEHRYAKRPHAGLDGATPYAAAAAYAGRLRRIEDPRALDMLLAPAPDREGRRTVGKQGVLIQKSHYLAPAVLPGTEVMVRMDPADLGRAYLFALDGGQFLGEAVCPEILGVDPVEAVARAKAAQKTLIDTATAEIRREARKIKPRHMAEAILGRAARESDNLVVFPRPADAHTTPAIEAAAAAAAPPAATPAPTLDQAQRVLQAEIEADLSGAEPSEPPATNVQILRRIETPQQRFRRALELRASFTRGDFVEPADLIWLGNYEAGSEHRALSDLYADFGEDALSG